MRDAPLHQASCNLKEVTLRERKTTRMLALIVQVQPSGRSNGRNENQAPQKDNGRKKLLQFRSLEGDQCFEKSLCLRFEQLWTTQVAFSSRFFMVTLNLNGLDVGFKQRHGACMYGHSRRLTLLWAFSHLIGTFYMRNNPHLGHRPFIHCDLVVQWDEWNIH